MQKKLVLAYVDSMRSDMLELAIANGATPTFAKLLERGTFIPDCVSSFPSVTPVACAEIATGVGAKEHRISGMNWYHRLERRYVEYGSSLEATRAFGLFRALYDLVYNMNLAHLSPQVQTLFERLDDAGVRTASTPFLIYRGRHRHEVSLEGLLRRVVEASRLKFRHATWGPSELFYGELYSSRPLPCRPTSRPGARDQYSACCSAELASGDLFDFLLFSLPDNDYHSHRHGPGASLESLATADRCFARLISAAGGLDGFLTDHSLILMADHAQSPVHRELPLAAELARRWRVLRPSEERPQDAELAVSPNSRAAHVYLLAPTAEHVEVRRILAEMQGIDLIGWLRRADGQPLNGGAEADAPGIWAVVQRNARELRFRPGDEVRDLRGRGWEVDGDLGVLDLSFAEGQLLSDSYPDPLMRLWSALLAPNAGDIICSLALGYECVDWGGSSHVDGGSHGSLHREDSLGPLLFVGCGPKSASERRQWALRDIAPVVLDHFGAGAEAERTQGAAL